MLVSGLIPATGGTIAVGGTPVKGAVDNIAIVFQRDVLLDWRTVLGNVLLPVEIKRLDPESHRRRRAICCARSGLPNSRTSIRESFPAACASG